MKKMWFIIFLFIIDLFGVNCRNYCSDLHDLFNGKWNFENKVQNADFSQCPRTKLWVKSKVDLKILSENHLGEYMCNSNKFASYFPSSCEILDTLESFRLINDFYRKIGFNQLKIFVIGDSISGQHAIAFLCELEINGLFDSVTVDFHHDHTFRNDIPCSEKCLGDQGIDYRKHELVPCSACKDGIRKNYSTSDPLHWTHFVPPDTNLLVLGSGTWYNNLQFKCDDYEHEYSRTLSYLVPLLDSFIHQGISVVWMGLPPSPSSPSLTQQQQYEWDSFEGRNSLARSLLDPHGILFLDANRVIRERHHHDPSSVFSAGIHWCNPGSQSIPHYLIRFTLHTLAMRLPMMKHWMVENKEIQQYIN